MTLSIYINRHKFSCDISDWYVSQIEANENDLIKYIFGWRKKSRHNESNTSANVTIDEAASERWGENW